MPELLTRRQAALRTTAVAALAALALIQVIEMPYAFAQGRPIGVISALVVAACAGAGGLLLRAPARGARPAWSMLAAVGGSVLAGWCGTRVAAIPGVAEDAGRWTASAGLASAGLAAACLACAAAGAGVRPSREAALRVATALAVVAFLAPVAGTLLVATAPGPQGGHHASAEPGHARALATAAEEPFRPGFGGHAGRYVYPNATPPRLPRWALALAIGVALSAVYLAGGALQRRAQPEPSRRMVVA